MPPGIGMHTIASTQSRTSAGKDTPFFAKNNSGFLVPDVIVEGFHTVIFVVFSCDNGVALVAVVLDCIKLIMNIANIHVLVCTDCASFVVLSTPREHYFFHAKAAGRADHGTKVKVPDGVRENCDEMVFLSLCVDFLC